MNKNFRNYALIWVMLLAVFNVVCFVTPNEVAGMTKFGGAFWAGYIFINLAFIGNIAAAYFAFKAENLRKLFYNLPLITISYTGLILILIVGSLSMAIPDSPIWVGIIVCLLILAFNAIAIIEAGWAGALVSEVDEKIKTQTQFIKRLTVDAEGLVDRAKIHEVKNDCKKVYDAIRYSDPISNEALSVIEAKLTVKMDEFGNAVRAENGEQVKAIAEELVLLIKKRNASCKALK